MVGDHRGLHSDQGSRDGEHPGRARNPVIKVDDLAWLEFEKPDLTRAEAFAHAFGFATVLRTPRELQLRGAGVGTPCVIIRHGSRSRFRGMAFRTHDTADLNRLASATGGRITPLPESLGGLGVDLVDPNGIPVRVVTGIPRLEPLPTQAPHALNFGRDLPRVNATQRPTRAPAIVERLGHVVLQSTRYRQTLNWYLDTLGMIVSDFLYFPGQRDRGPTMSFIRCDRGSTPADHPHEARAILAALRSDNEFDLRRLAGLLKVASS